MEFNGRSTIFFQTKSLIVVVVNAYKQAHCADMGLYLFVGKAAGEMHAVFAKGWCDGGAEL